MEKNEFKDGDRIVHVDGDVVYEVYEVENYETYALYRLDGNFAGHISFKDAHRDYVLVDRKIGQEVDEFKDGDVVMEIDGRLCFTVVKDNDGGYYLVRAGELVSRLTKEEAAKTLVLIERKGT